MKRNCKRILAFCLAALLAGSLALCAAGAQKAAMDVVFLVDTSGSMDEYLDETIDLLRGYLDGLTESEAADFRFALVDYRDYPGKTMHEADYPYKVQADFTENAAAVSFALGGLDTGYGGDPEESVYSALIDGLSGLTWREDAGRVAVMIGDAAALDPETETGYTLPDATAALIDLGVTLHTVTALVNGTADPGEEEPGWGPVTEEPGLEDPDGPPAAEPFEIFQALADATGGEAVLLKDAAALLETMLAYARALPPPQDPPPLYAPNLNLPGSMTLYRKDSCTVFSAQDTADIHWTSSDPSVLTIDNNGRITYQFAKIGTVTIKAYETASGDELATVQVKVAWRWWQWILVIVLFGWIYL